MTTGELARAAGVNAQTIRYYERQKLLPAPHRWPGSDYRDFDEEALRRLRFIRAAKALGFTLREIKELLDLRLLPGESCAEVRQLFESKLGEIETRMREMRRSRRVLLKFIAACSRRRTPADCPALWKLEH